MRHGVSLLLACLVVAAPAAAQEPATRAEVLAIERQAKVEQMAAPRSGRVERALLALENRRLLERLLNPAEGFYPKVGNITPGSGFALGPGYRRPRIFGDAVDFSAFAVASVQQYWMLDARLSMPELAAGRLFADVHARRYDFPREDFFGLGPDSRREDLTRYRVRGAEVGGVAGARLTPAFTLSSAVDYLTPEVRQLTEQPDYVRAELSGVFNTRQPRGNPRQGGRYALAYQRFDAQGGSGRDFGRMEADVQQYISLYRNRRVLALRGFVSATDADAVTDIPFYLLRTLGGPDDLRGFRRFRFRDRNVLLLQAEYRWEIFTAVDGAVFYDAGKVAPRIADLGFSDLETDYGIGFRFGTSNGVFLRVEGAFGSSDGPHFILRFGHVF